MTHFSVMRGLGHIRFGGPARIAHFGRDQKLVPGRGSKAAQQRLGRAIGIEVRGVEMRDARSVAGLEHRLGGGFIRSPAELHGTKGKAADGRPIQAGHMMCHTVKSDMADQNVQRAIHWTSRAEGER